MNINFVNNARKFLKGSGRGHHKNGSGGLFALNDPRSPVVEAFRTLRTNINFASADRPYKVILVTSPTPSDGKSTVVANLGMVMAQAGNKVLIVDADLRKPTQHRIFEVINSKGLVNLIVQGEELSEVVHAGPIDGLHLITSGPIPPNPSELLVSDRMANLMSELRERYDIVLIDSPPVIAVTDSTLLASKVDGSILVIKSGITRIDLINNALDQLKKANERFLGVVLNQVRVESRDYSYYYYYGGSKEKTLAT